jgi:ribosomal protein L37AE/L43A
MTESADEFIASLLKRRDCPHAEKRLVTAGGPQLWECPVCGQSFTGPDAREWVSSERAAEIRSWYP